jgi:ubiquitin-conjugating enzyme E2 variant
MERSEIRQELAQYPAGMRAVEISALIGFTALFATVLFSHIKQAGGRAWLIPLGALTGLVIMDFLSGLVHWFADTWGTSRWPVLGPTLIRSFREHHVDRFAITRHDFIETNGATALVALPMLLVAFFTRGLLESNWAFYAASTLTFISFWGLWTNQFHKWAHMARAPRPIAYLQKKGIVLSVVHHAEHHRGDYDMSYCITTGWLNPLLNRVGFFRHAERLVSAVTGMTPRAEDKILVAAVTAKR